MASSDFFSRWAAKPVPGSPVLPPAVSDAPQAGASNPAQSVDPRIEPGVASNAPSAATEAASPPTLEQARALTPGDDFRAFVRPEVDPQVRNAAMKQLFTDPHFNVMDGLDIYIDDYNTPDPLPASDLARMASAHFLRLIHSDPEATPVEDASSHPVQAAVPTQEPNPTEEKHRDDPDLRLQPDSEPRSAGPGSGAE